MKNEKNELLDFFTNFEKEIKCPEFPLRKLIPRVDQRSFKVINKNIIDSCYKNFPEIPEKLIIKLNKYGIDYEKIIKEKWNIRKENRELKKILNSNKKEKRSRL